MVVVLSRGYRSCGEGGWMTVDPLCFLSPGESDLGQQEEMSSRGLSAERGREPRSWWLALKGSLYNLTIARALADHILSLKTLPEVDYFYVLLDSLCVSLLWITLVLETHTCRELPSFIKGDHWKQYG